MKEYILYQIDAFTKNKFEGNPAGVIINADGLTDNEMLLIARELNNSETAFLFSAPDDLCDGVIRYFTPTTEVPTCGHATIAAMYAKAVHENLNSCLLNYKTKIGILPFEIHQLSGDYKITMTQGEFTIKDSIDSVTKNRLLKACGLNNEDLNPNCPIQIASTGHSKVMIGINDVHRLNELDPNLAELKKISRVIRCQGYFVFVIQTGNTILTQGRMFAPAIGIDEDPVTGNANGPLGGYLVHHDLVTPDSNSFHFKGKQGVKIGRPGVMDVKVLLNNRSPEIIQISGEAVIAFQTTITI